MHLPGPEINQRAALRFWFKIDPGERDAVADSTAARMVIRSHPAALNARQGGSACQRLPHKSGCRYGSLHADSDRCPRSAAGGTTDEVHGPTVLLAG